MRYTQARLEHALNVFRDFKPYLQTRKPSQSTPNLATFDKRKRYALREASSGKCVAAGCTPSWTEPNTKDSDDDYDPGLARKKRAHPTKRQCNSLKRKANTIDTGCEKKRLKHQHNGEADSLDDLVENSPAKDTIHIKLTSEKGRQLLLDLAIMQFNDGDNVQWHKRSDEQSYPKRDDGSLVLVDSSSRSQGDQIFKEQKLDGFFFNDEIADRIQDKGRRLRSGKVTTHEAPLKKKMMRGIERNLEKEADSDISQAKQGGQISDIMRHSAGLVSRRMYSLESPSNDNRCNEHDIRIPLPQGDDIIPSRQAPIPLDQNRTTGKETYASPFHNTTPCYKENSRHSKHHLDSVSSPTVITTCFSHPVDLRHNPQASSSSILKGCHFCNDWRFGILGYGKRNVRVVADPNHFDLYKEIEGGHRAESKEKTRMCISCALDRLMIVRCHGHQNLNPQLAGFSKIPHAATSSTEQQKWLAEMFKQPSVAQHPHLPQEPFPCCNICPAPALYQCCRWQRRNKVGRPCKIPDAELPLMCELALWGKSQTPSFWPATSTAKSVVRPLPMHPTSSTAHSQKDNSVGSAAKLESPIKGCGLKLCLACYNVIKHRCRGELIKKIISEYISTNSIGGRADWEYLIKGGTLDIAYNVRPTSSTTKGAFENIR